MRPTLGPLALSLLLTCISISSAYNTEYDHAGRTKHIDAQRTRENADTATDTQSTLTPSTLYQGDTTIHEFESSITVYLYNSTCADCYSTTTHDYHHYIGDHPRPSDQVHDGQVVHPAHSPAQTTEAAMSSNLTFTSSSLSVTASLTSTNFLATTLTPSLTLDSTDTVIDLAPSTTSVASTIAVGGNMTADATGSAQRGTITSYTTVGGSSAAATQSSSTVPVVAGQNGGVKLGVGAWTVVMLGFGSVIAGLLV